MTKNSTPRPIAFILAATNHGTMIVNRHDQVIAPDGQSGYGVGFQLLNISAFDQDEVDLVIQLLESRKIHFGSGVIAIDCGANIGVHTIEWSKLMHNWGEIIAIEAQERIFYALAGNISLNNCFNVKAIWAAIGNNVGTINVPIPNYFTPSSFGSLEIRKTIKTEYIGQEIDYSDQRTQITPLISIDSLGLNRLDFIKVDIEGMEMEALTGAHHMIKTHKPQLLIETIKSNKDEIYSFMSDLGYKTYEIGINLLAIHHSDPAASIIKAT